jgi:two-component system sensor histidine kinase PrrB
VFAAAAGVAELVVGRRAARPLARLRAGAESIDRSDPATWSVDAASGTPDVDVAAALNAGLAQLADATARRAAALDTARAFAASAAHELRTPLQSALTNLDIADSAAASAEARAEATDLARGQLRRAADGLAAIRALADAEFADPAWFRPTDLGDLVDAAVAGEVTISTGPLGGARVTVDLSPGPGSNPG